MHNASILCDLVAKKNEAVILDMLQELKNLKDGIVLLKVWMRQRELDKVYCCLLDKCLMTVIIIIINLTIITMCNFPITSGSFNIWELLNDNAGHLFATVSKIVLAHE